MQILEDLKRSIDSLYGDQLHPQYRIGVHEEKYKKDKEKIESIFGIQFPKEFYRSFWYLNGLYNEGDLSLYSLGDLDGDNFKLFDLYGDLKYNYIIVGQSGDRFFIYDNDSKNFGTLSRLDWLEENEFDPIDKNYEFFLNDVLNSYVLIEENEEI